MKSDAVKQSTEVSTPALAGRITLSPWVNERFPGWDQILSAHEVARLTRRPRWMLCGMSLLGQFPKKHRFHGRRIGWLRSEIVDWLAKDLTISTRCSAPSPRRRRCRALRAHRYRSAAHRCGPFQRCLFPDHPCIREDARGKVGSGAQANPRATLNKN